MSVMYRTGLFIGIAAIIWLAVVGLFVTFVVLVVKALLKYLRSDAAAPEDIVIKRTLAETLKEHRLRCNMTQEFVANALGVTRQAVSKWENGTAELSTTKLCALAKLYGVDAAELLRGISKK